MEISKFNEKLNKIDGNIYVVEEKVELTGGVHDGPLQHDNINTSTLSVYTGPKLTGERIQSYTLSTPSLTPWKRIIRIYADVPVVYISYEAEGDTVEAGDVNLLQEEIVRTQEAVNEEITRAGEAEQNIAADLEEEVTRAKAAENTLAEDLSAEKTRAMAAEESIRGTIQSNKPIWDNKYTRNEVDNKFAALENAIDWKEAVNTYADIAEAYPDPQDGWTVNVKDTDYTYRYSGTEWVVISANAIPKATQSVDGLLAKEDKALYDDANSKKHTHSNKSTIDKITETLLARWNEAYDKRHEHENKGILDTVTQAMLDNWNAAFNHISDAVKHITATERTNWNDANSKKHTHSNKSILDGITQTLIDRWNAANTHVSDTVKHITAEEREAWNTVSDKVDTVAGKGLSTNDYTNAERNKLTGIVAGAEVNVQADWNETDAASDAYINNKPGSLPASDVSAWAKAVSKPGYSWSEISGKPSSFIPAAHTHTKSQISDMPTKVSAFENDSGYITAADIDSSQNHTHANKSLLDTITQTLLNNWNAAFTHVSNKSNPHSVTAAQVGAAATSHTHTKANITDFPTSLPANGGNAETVNGHVVNADVPAGAKFTDTVYSHPNSGVTAGDYRSVTVNAQGHVIAGTNPTTLAGYGITDAAAKAHNHDSTYLKKTGLTWDDLKGV